MKKITMLAIACTIALNSNGQAVVGSKNADSVLLVTSNTTKMYLTPPGRISVNNGPTTDGTQYATMTVKKLNSTGSTKDHTGLLVSDNDGQPFFESQLGVMNQYSDIALYVNNSVLSTNVTAPNKSGIVCDGGRVGFFRRAHPTPSVQGDFVGFRSGIDFSSEGSNPTSLTGFSSGGTVFPSNSSFGTLTDFIASDWADASGTWGVRYGLKLDFSQQGSAAAWGVYQTSDEVKNHFNGASLFGSTTDNTYDKAQVTGGTKTDGLAASIRTVPTSGTTYTALNTDYTLLVNTAGSTITLPSASSTPNVIAAGKIYVIKQLSGTGSGTIYVDPDGAATIDGAANYPLTTQYSFVTLQFDGTNYHVIGN